MRLYFYLGKHMRSKDYDHAIFAMEVMATSYGYGREEFKAIKLLFKRRKGFYNEKCSSLIAFDCKTNQFRILNHPEYEQKLLGDNRAFMWYSDNGGEWKSVRTESKQGLIIKGQKTYINFD